MERPLGSQVIFVASAPATNSRAPEKGAQLFEERDRLASGQFNSIQTSGSIPPGQGTYFLILALGISRCGRRLELGLISPAIAPHCFPGTLHKNFSARSGTGERTVGLLSSWQRKHTFELQRRVLHT